MSSWTGRLIGIKGANKKWRDAVGVAFLYQHGLEGGIDDLAIDAKQYIGVAAGSTVMVYGLP
jgi:hypothetical protein